MADLYDILVRHQVYLEGLKKGRTADFPTVLAKLDNALRTNLAHIDYDDLGEITKRKLNELLVALRKAMRSIFDPWLAALADWLDRYMVVEVEAFNAYFQTDADPEVVKSAINNEPMGTGLLWFPFLKGSTVYAMTRIERLVTFGYANRQSPNEIVRGFLGTKAKGYRDGIGRSLDNATSAAIATAMQHISAQASMNAAKRRFGKYEWISVLDDATTDVCRDRDGNVYVYGRGPMPPAHVRCRSTIAPVFDGRPASADIGFNLWASRQSEAFVNDAFDGKVPPRYEGSSALSLSEYRAKRPLIIS